MPTINSSAICPSSTGSASGSAFTPEFFLARAVDTTAGDVRPDGVPTGAIHYCATTHGTHGDFCAGSDFVVYRDQVRRNLDMLVGFCACHCMPDTPKIAASFDLFFQHRFHKNYFSQYAELVDSRGKQCLDNICGMLGDERIPKERKQAAIRNLSEGVSVCASGVTANLIAMDRDLAASTVNIRALLQIAKDDMVRADLLKEVSLEFSILPNYKGNEIHYLHAVWNYVADAVGLLLIPDPQAMRLEPEFLEACQRKLLDRLTPDRMAYLVGERLLQLFGSLLAEGKVAASGPCTALAFEKFNEILEMIRLEHRIPAEVLDKHAFVRLDDGGAHYEVRGDPSLIARGLLTLMHQEKLLNAAACSLGEWMDEDGVAHALYTYGNALTWRATPSARNDAAGWDVGGEAELLTFGDLFAWAAVEHPGYEVPPSAALLQAVPNSDPDDPLNMPSKWWPDRETTLALLGRLDSSQMDRFLRANMDYLLKEFSGERDRLIDAHFGRGRAILTLARHWYGSPYELMGWQRDGQSPARLQRWMASGNWQAIDALLQDCDAGRYLATGSGGADGDVIVKALSGESGTTALYEAMSMGHAKAIASWHRLLVDPLVVHYVADSLPAMLAGRSSTGTPALAIAMGRGHASAVQAYHELVADPAIAPRILGDLPELLAARTGNGIPALSLAMQQGYADVVEAYHAMLVDDTVLPHIRRALPDLVIAMTQGGTTGLIQAMSFGRERVIRAFHAMLVDTRIQPHIARKLPDLFLKHRTIVRPALNAALYNGHAGAIKAFHALLADQSVAPHIKSKLPELMATRTHDGCPGLATALEKGQTDAIRAYHELLADPAILPHVGRTLPKLLAARRRDRMFGLSLALSNNHAGAVAAFGEMLADPRLLPWIGHSLPKLVAARDLSGRPALLRALWGNQRAAIGAFRTILSRPEIAARLGDPLLQELRALGVADASPAAAGDGSSQLVRTQGEASAGDLPVSIWQRFVRGVMRRLTLFRHRLV